MAVSNGEIIKAILEFVLYDGSIAQNILHFLANFASEQTDGDVIDAIEQYAQDLYDAIDGHIDSAVDVNQMTVQVVEWSESEGIWEVTRLVGYGTPSITFTSAVNPQANQISAVLVANTSRPKTRGRKFLLPFSTNSANGSQWVSGVLTDLATCLSHFLADELVTTGNQLSPGVPRTEAGEFQEFTDGVVNSIVGTQRRRKPGVGA